jgi:hypothetical protein
MVPMRLDSAASLGSTAELGEEDFVVTGELPNIGAAGAGARSVAAAGGSSLETTVLLTESEVDEARARTATFRAPGR